MKGLRVKMTFTFSAVGTSAPIFITAYGLNEREMPHDKSIIVPLKGLCIGGGGVNMSGTTIGHVLFMRKQENADSIRYTHYLKNILLPFIQESRFQFDGLEKEDPIPDKLSAVSWCDGNIKQIQT